jgi:hypothetical protein
MVLRTTENHIHALPEKYFIVGAEGLELHSRMVAHDLTD